ncbi:MAG: hypothetical protein RL562_2349 [Planctomycetota bacterium]|jgi:AcrR family transcriptional regulator
MKRSGDKRGRGRPKTFDRSRVLDVAMDSYWRDGVDGLSLNEICRRSGVSKPGLYREFGGEDGLMDAVLEQYAGAVLEPLTRLLESDRPFGQVLADLIASMTQAERSQPAGCLLAKMRGSPSRLGPATRARLDALRAGAVAAYAAWVGRGKARGEIAPDIPTDVAAAFLDTQFTTLLVQMAAGEDPALLRGQARLAFMGLTAASADGGSDRG